MPTTAEVLHRMMTDPEYGKKMNEDFGNMEFQMEIAPYVGYQGPVDPSIARFHGLPFSEKTTLKGFTVPDGYEAKKPYMYAGEEGIFAIPKEQGTVNAVNADATPNVWGHEYRHRQDMDMSEKQNRLLDGYYAQDQASWKAAVRLWLDQMGGGSMLDAEKDLIKQLNKENMNVNSPYGQTSKEYELQKSGERQIIPDSEVTHGNWFKDVLSPKSLEFAAGRKRGQYWSQAEAALENRRSIMDAVNQGIADANSQ